MDLGKKGFRILGIAESFSSRQQSLIAGVVMRRDLRIDGVAFSSVTVGGTDATGRILDLFFDLRRRDINGVMISGCVIAWFNVIDPGKIASETGLPVVCVTYEHSDGLASHIVRHFPEDMPRLRAYEKLGERVPVRLDTGYTIYLRAWGMEQEDAVRLCRIFTHDGKVPEPVRVARLVARGIMHGTNGVI